MKAAGFHSEELKIYKLPILSLGMHEEHLILQDFHKILHCDNYAENYVKYLNFKSLQRSCLKYK